MIFSKEWWELWYKKDMCSGAGSRGKNAIRKINVINYLINAYNLHSILDLGCGELYWAKNLNIEKYEGIDISDNVIKFAKTIKPEWRNNLKTMDICNYNTNSTFDLVLLMDVLLHQPDEEMFNIILDKGIQFSNKFVYFSAVGPEKNGSIYYSIEEYENEYKIYDFHLSPDRKLHFYLLDKYGTIKREEEIDEIRKIYMEE